MTSVERFRTRRLSGERLRLGDLHRWSQVYQDPKVAATLGGVRSVEALNHGLSKHLRHWTLHGFGYFVLSSLADGEFVGIAGLQNVRVGGDPGVELGYSLRPPYWGRGLATEAGEALLGIGFEQLRLGRIVSYTRVTNTASRRVMEKLGFQYEREVRHAGFPHAFCVLSARRAPIPATAP